MISIIRLPNSFVSAHELSKNSAWVTADNVGACIHMQCEMSMNFALGTAPGELWARSVAANGIRTSRRLVAEITILNSSEQRLVEPSP